MSIRSYGGEVQKLVPDVVATPDPEPYEEADAKELTASIRMVPSKRGEKVHVPLCESSKTDLHRAVDNSDPELLEQLLATKTIDINAQSWDLSTALLISVIMLPVYWGWCGFEGWEEDATPTDAF